MNKTIKNYTTTIPVRQTIAEIQELLAKNGARNIMFDYTSDGQLSAVVFAIDYDGKRLPFRLPAKADSVYQTLFAKMRGGRSYESGRREKAYMIAWRICKDWLESQITLINLEQAKVEEVFLPYLLVGKNETLFDRMKNQQFLLPE